MVTAKLFLSSFSPLFALLAVRFQPVHLWVPLLIAAALGAGALIDLMRARGEVVANPRRFVQLRSEGSQVGGYLASYVLPLLAIPEPSWRDVLAYVGFLVVYFVVVLRAGLLQVNPLLHLYGYRLFSAQDEVTGESVYLLNKGSKGLRDGVYLVSDIAASLLLVQTTSPPGVKD